MRLIDADALKREVEGLVVGGAESLKDYYENGSEADENSWIGGVYDTWERINNAPTVKFSLLPADESKEEAYMRGYKIGKAEGILKANTRPKGEWIELPKAFDSRELPCKCSICEHILSFINFYPKSNFCPNCGADMRNGGEEE